MTTTISSTKLDFETIKSKLKTFLEQDDQFSDYDFEGSGLNSILDVLAYNTHFSGLVANFALNESYLGTAQLRNSVVSLAESLGYVPGSKSSSQCAVNFTINLAGVPDLNQIYSFLPGEVRLKGSIDGVDYVFSNRKTITADSAGTGIYNFLPFDDPNASTMFYEGEEKTQQYLVDGSANAIYVVPDENIDISTAIVKIYTDASSANSNSGSYSVYNNIFTTPSIDSTSRLYLLRESPNQFYELSFGAFNSLGISPVPGNIIEINYLVSSGTNSNGISLLTLKNELSFAKTDGDLYNIPANNVITNTPPNNKSSGGTEKEDIESIRKRAPFQYASQNRMVTPLDYEAMILRKYNSFIEDIICWGGEDNLPPEYGTAFASIVWKEGLSSTAVGELRNGIKKLSRELSVLAFTLKFVEATEVYISSELIYQFNPTLGAGNQSDINFKVQTSVSEYFQTNVGKFEQVFRRSKLLAQIDQVDLSVLSSRSNITLQKRISPIIGLAQNWDISFAAQLKQPDKHFINNIIAPVIRSTPFDFMPATAQFLKTVGPTGLPINPTDLKPKKRSVYIRNAINSTVLISKQGQTPIRKLKPSNKLEMVDSLTGIIVAGQDNIGFYNPLTGAVRIINLSVVNTLNANNYIKVFGIPENDSFINPSVNSTLKYDQSESSVTAVTVTNRV